MQAWARQQSLGVQIKSLDNFWQKPCWQGLQKRELALVRQSPRLFNWRHFTISEAGFEKSHYWKGIHTRKSTKSDFYTLNWSKVCYPHCPIVCACLVVLMSVTMGETWSTISGMNHDPAEAILYNTLNALFYAHAKAGHSTAQVTLLLFDN